MYHDSKKKVIVNAAALRSSGALSIYNQFITHLSEYIGRNLYYIFVDPSVNQPPIEGVTYIQDDNHSWKHRILWEHGGLNDWLKTRDLVPDVIVSLQNTGVVTDCRQVIYYHQSLPFYDWKWNPLKKAERIMWLYKHVYPYFVKSTLNNKTDVVVQIPYIKRMFVERFRFNPDKVHVLFPDVEHIEIKSVACLDWDMSMIHFLFPATLFPYKKHCNILRALNILKRRNSVVFSKIKVHFTISAGESKSMDELIKSYGLKEQIVMEGEMPHSKLLSCYKTSQGLLFPSVIETLGLPLLEAASFGLPIVVSDLGYSREVLQGYSGAVFVESENIERWADEIERIALLPQKCEPVLPMESSWGHFFDLVMERM